MCPSVFDDGSRDIVGGADHLVSQLEYLNRSDRDEAERVRGLVEDLFSRYPADAQGTLQTRLRSVDDNQHMASFFELVLHELLLRAGCQILAVEPSLEGTDCSPDFFAQTETGALLSRGDGPQFIYEQHGVRFRVAVIPRHQTRGTTERGRAIAGRMVAPLSVQLQEPIRTAVLGKAERYGDLDAPYIVAVNALSTYAREDYAVVALFGTEVVSVRQTAEGFEDRIGRDTDGLWYGPRGPVNTRFSGVLSTERLGPWSLGQRRARLFKNPWARRPLAASPLAIDVREVRDDRLLRTAGSSIAELLELPEGWPE